MERKSLVIGPRTRQDILKGKHIRKYEDGGDNFEDYWTDSDDGSSSISKDSEHFLELPEEVPHIQSSTFFKTSDGRKSSLRQKIDQSPLKSRNVQSPPKSRNVQSPPKSRNVQSPLKSRNVQSPLKSRNVQSPLKSRSVQSPLKSRSVQSPPKSKEVLPNISNVNEVATEFQDMTVNLGIDDDNLETEALNRFSGDIVKNNLPPKLSSITSEIQNMSNSSLSIDREEYNESEMPRLVSRVSFKTSKKSISRSTKKDPKIREVQLQFDELDEKIMQMVCANDDDIQNSTVSEEEMSTEQSSFIEKNTESEIEQVSKNIEEKENCSEFELHSQNESSTRSIKRNTRSLGQSVNDSESLSLRNAGIKRSKNTLECQKDQKERVTCQENDFIQSQCTEKKSNLSSVPQYEKISSETFISKKNLTDNRSHSMDVSVNSDDDESHITSEQDIETDEIPINKQMAINKNTVPENVLNSPVNSLENTNGIDIDEVNDSSEKIIKQQEEKNKNVSERIDPIHQHSSKTVMSENSLPDSPNANSHFEKSKFLEDSLPRSKTISSDNKNISKSTFSDTLDIDNTSNICMVEKQKAANEKNVIPDKSIHDAASFNQTRTAEKQKSSISKKYNSAAEGNDSIGKGEVNIEKTTKKLNKIKNNKSKTTGKKYAFMSDEDIETADLDSISQLQTSNRKTRNSSRAIENYDANISLNSVSSSANSISGVNKTSKKQNKSANKTSQTKNKKSDVMPDKVDLETTDIDSLSHLQTSKQKENYSSLRKTAKNKRTSSMLCDENIVEAAILNDSSLNPITKRQKKSVNKRNSLISQENDLARASISSSEESLNNVNMKKTTKKQKKVENSKKRRLHDKSNVEHMNQSKEQVSKKIKSTVGENSLDKENERSVEAAIRRSKRTKYAPLAHWRNERLQYRFEGGNITEVKVDKGTKADIAFLESLNNKLVQKKKISKPKKATVLDVIKKKEKQVHLLKKYPLVSWDSPVRCRTDENPQFAFLIKRMMETKKNSFGYIYIDANKEKPPQYMPEEDLLLIVVEGNLEINVQKDTFILENKDMFIVPRGAAYGVKNIGKKRALLSYAVGKFQFLESL